MPEEHYAFMPHRAFMQPDEIEEIAKEFVRLGIRKIRLTGGEPLSRKDFPTILGRLAKLPVELHITTNAVLLDRYIEDLKEAGVRTLNISLDTLNADTFLFLTKRDKFRQTLKNIELALAAGFHIKINTVVMKGVNEQELPDFVGWTKDAPIEVRFIEFMPFNGNHWTSNKVLSEQEMLNQIGWHYRYYPLPSAPHDTAKHYGIDKHQGHFAIISTMSAPFCAGCNRMRLTADGKMKNCLFSKGETDLLSALRAGEPLEPLIRQNVREKAKGLGGQLAADFNLIKQEEIENRSMISIGG